MTVLPLLLAAVVATPAHASDEENRSVAVRTADLDLNSAEGRKRLDRRIHRAARSVCGPDIGASRISSNRCVRRAETAAWQNMESRGFFARTRPAETRTAETPTDGPRTESRPLAALNADSTTRGQVLGHLNRR
jgi:UrcA family protein